MTELVTDWEDVEQRTNREPEVVDPLDDTPFGERRLGTFSIPLDWLEGMRDRDSREVFKRFRILKADFDFATKCIEYVAASFLFDPCPLGAKAPGYTIMVDAGDGSAASIRVRKN